MEDVLAPHAEPRDAARAVACFDEASKELHAEVRDPTPAAPGRPARRDYEYARRGTLDFAEQMRRLCDERYAEATTIRVVLDDLDTHGPQSLFAAFAPEEAWRPARRPEFHPTPEHASWLNMAELELSVPSRRIADAATLASEVSAREGRRSEMKAEIAWTFRPADARVNLAQLYPQPEKPSETSVSGH